MTPKQKQRWKLECDIMRRLDHRHVVAAKDIPDILNKYNNTQELPLMGMEYCDGGDLRKVINKPANCCGLPQHQVRCILRDICSAIEYLHSLRIIHRDLKPDNIVIKTVEDRVVYQLIDLGYAKDLDQGSVAMSFVGTMQYLAPELFHNSRYSSTVDYWSFGITMFECITGFRPFLHSVAPIRWQQMVSKKTNAQIHAFFNDQGAVKFSENVPYPNHLNRYTQQILEKWMRYMLQWDAGTRGGGMSQNDRPVCFDMMDTYLNSQVLNVYCVPTNEVLTYCVSQNQLFKEIQSLIAQETNIPIQEQEILQLTGVPIDSNAPVQQCCNSMTEEDQIVYLYRKNSTSFNLEDRKTVPFPPGTRRLMNDTKTLMVYDDQKTCWGHSVFYCKEVASNFRRLKDAQRAYNMYLMRYKSVLSQCKNQMKDVAGDLKSKTEFFHKSLQFDIGKLAGGPKSGIYSPQLHTSWMSMNEEVTKSHTINEGVSQMDSQCESIDVEVIELQRSPFAKARQVDTLTELEKRATKYFEELRSIPPDERSKNATRKNDTMSNVVSKCLKEYREMSNALYMHLSKIAACKIKVAKLIPEVQDIVKKLKEHKRVLMDHQERRQKEVWSLLGFAFKRAGQATPPASSSFGASSNPSLGTPPVLNLTAEGGPQTPEDLSTVNEVFARNQQLSSTLQKETIEHMTQLSLAVGKMPEEDLPPVRIDKSSADWGFLDSAFRLASDTGWKKS